MLSSRPNQPRLLRSIYIIVVLLSFIHCALSSDVDVDLRPSHIGAQGSHDGQEKGPTPNASSSVARTDYTPELPDMKRDVVDRAPAATVATVVPTGLANNVPISLNAMPGATNAAYYSYALTTATATAQVRRNDDTTITNSRIEEEDVENDDDHDHDDGPAAVKRQSGTSRTVYISITTCLQPTFLDQKDIDRPPQLTLYVSTTSSNPNPGPNSGFLDEQQAIPLVEGFANATANVASSVFIGVVAPDVRIADGTVWNYQVAASTDAFYHAYSESLPEMFLIDADPNAALLITSYLTSLAPDNSTAIAYNNWLNSTHNAPLDVFVANQNNTATKGILHSYCGLNTAPSVLKPGAVGYNKTITYNQPDKVPEQEFYVPGLNRTSNYTGVLARTGNSTATGAGVIGGGGTIFKSMTFKTKRDQNCQVIYDLPFCDQVEYAVPANPSRMAVGALRDLYDQEAYNLYQNFSLSLAQIPCNTTPTAQYSLVTNCTACASAYKTWLCAVTIPRCEDFTSPSSIQFPNGPADAATDTPPDPDAPAAAEQWYLMPRNLAQAPLPAAAPLPAGFVDNATLQTWLATNSSRNNQTIAGTVQPGPYHEVLPCEDLCFDIVRHCPAKLGFSCPPPGSRMLRASYGARGRTAGGASTCSAPGVVYTVNGAAALAAGGWLVWGAAVGVALWISGEM